MDLRTGNAPWSSQRPTALSLGPLDRDETCDVLIVGTGISGAMAAFHLAEAGANVILVDRRPLSTGSTSVSTALIQYELDVPMVELIPRMGLADAQGVYRATRVALEDLRYFVEGNDLACDFIQRPSLYLAARPDDVLHLHHESIARQQIGIESTWLDAPALASTYRIDRPGAIRSAVAFELNPRKLTAQLLAESVDRFGARIYDRTTLAGDPWVGTAPTLRTVDGFTIRCRHIVYATGYETPEQFPQLKALCTLKSTYALSTHPVPEEQIWAERAMLWEYAQPYFYARTLPDNRLLIGGEDVDIVEPAGRDALLPEKVERLLYRFGRTTGLTGLTVDRSWAATFAETEDGLPFIGSPGCAPGCFFNLGFGGNGILFSLLGAQIIRDGLTGKTHPAARYFGFDRPGLSAQAQGVQLSCP